MAGIPFEDYVASLGRLTAKIDPTASTPAAEEIREAVEALEALEGIDIDSVTAWAVTHPEQTYVLALVVGMSREKLTNQLRDWFSTGSWRKAALDHGADFITRLDEDFDLLRLLRAQRGETYSFGDVLVARAGTRATAASAGQSGRKIEGELEAIAQSLHLPISHAHALRDATGALLPLIWLSRWAVAIASSLLQRRASTRLAPN